MMIIVNADNFKEEVTEFKGQVIVEFGSGSCSKCKMLKSHIEQLSEEYTDNMDVKFTEKSSCFCCKCT